MGKERNKEQNQQPNATYEKQKVHKNAYFATVPAKQDSVMKRKHHLHGGDGMEMTNGDKKINTKGMSEWTGDESQQFDIDKSSMNRGAQTSLPSGFIMYCILDILKFIFYIVSIVQYLY